MCGIAGIAFYSDHQKAESSVRKMTQAIQHRGPDASGLWVHPSCVLGHRRLSIIDTSEAGNQPFHAEDGTISLVFNGEIYNYLELRDELKHHHTFKTSSDTEVIIAAYQVWGIQAVQRFIGMFGFALWDENKQTLFVVRDRLGVKPVYYCEIGRAHV